MNFSRVIHELERERLIRRRGQMCLDTQVFTGPKFNRGYAHKVIFLERRRSWWLVLLLLYYRTPIIIIIICDLGRTFDPDLASSDKGCDLRCHLSGSRPHHL